MIRARTKVAAKAEAAATLFRQAEKLEHRRPVDFCERVLNPIEAQRKHEEAARLLAVGEHSLAGSARTELVSKKEPDEQWTAEREYIIDTLENPNAIAVDASEQRASLAARANVLSPALDAVQTVGAGNSLEKMLCHQLAAVHTAGMERMVRASRNDLPPLEHARLLNTVARMFEAYSSGCLTLQKLKTGGKQHVVVQYQQQVNVGSGGQAVVAGKVGRGSRRGRKRPNDR
jgi:hypothetical protein